MDALTEQFVDKLIERGYTVDEATSLAMRAVSIAFKPPSERSPAERKLVAQVHAVMLQ